jgi:hypothetical protein
VNAISEIELPALTIEGKDTFRRTASAPSAVLGTDRAVILDRMRQPIGYALTCQTVLNQGRNGFGIEFCGKPSRRESGKVTASYCVPCCELHFVAIPWGNLSNRAMSSIRY